MLKNYFKVAFRNILKNKVYSFINIAGLAVGMAACILIALYVINEESYDRLHKNADRIVRATMKYRFGGVTKEVAITGTKLLPAFKRNFPEVESGVRMYDTRAIVKYQNNVFEEPNFAFADSTFFQVFSFKLLEGNPVKALANPYSVILTLSAARKYFGSPNAIGKIIRINTRSLTSVSWNDYTVTGVMQDYPSNSQIKFDFLTSFCSLPVAGYENWLDADYFTYLLLNSPQSIKTLRAKIPAYMKTQDKELGLTGNDYLTFNLEPLKRVHLYSEVEGGFEPSGDYRYVLIFSLIALLILGISCANYINITIAKAVERAKEVGVRKVIGAFRLQLFYQFTAESFFVAVASFFIGLMFVEFALPVFKNLYGTRLTLSSLISTEGAVVLVLLILLIGLLGAAYPAFILSRFQPVKVLKGSFRTGSGVWLRKGLIVFQFIISAALIICTFIIKDQLDYIQNKKLGYDKNNIAVLPVDETIIDKTNVLKNEFLKNSNIIGTTLATRTPVFINSTNHIVYDNKKILVNQLGVDRDFLKTLEVKLIAGSNFTQADTINYMSRTSNINLPIIVNETLLRQLNLPPDKAIGMALIYGGRNCMIKGVIKDFHFASMHVRINPLVLFPNGYLSRMMVKMTGSNLKQTINYMKEKWDALVPDHPFNLTFLNDDFNKLYDSEARTQEIFYVFGVLAIALAGLGLFGLVSFSVQQRTKEIGIRKTLGAGSGNIIVLLSKDYIKLVILANIIAYPIALYAVSKWLEGFAYRTDISVLVFILVMISILILVMFIIGLQAIKAAIANPIESLRYE